MPTEFGALEVVWVVSTTVMLCAILAIVLCLAIRPRKTLVNPLEVRPDPVWKSTRDVQAKPKGRRRSKGIIHTMRGKRTITSRCLRIINATGEAFTSISMRERLGDPKPSAGSVSCELSRLASRGLIEQVREPGRYVHYRRIGSTAVVRDATGGHVVRQTRLGKPTLTSRLLAYSESMGDTTFTSRMAHRCLGVGTVPFRDVSSSMSEMARNGLLEVVRRGRGGGMSLYRGKKR